MRDCFKAAWRPRRTARRTPKRREGGAAFIILNGFSLAGPVRFTAPQGPRREKKETPEVSFRGFP